MKIEELKEMYNLSQDYDLLEKLVLEGKEIPCFVTYDINYDKENPLIVTDIASARFIQSGSNSKYDNIIVANGGRQFISTYPNDEYWKDKYPFAQECKPYDLWFILPNFKVNNQTSKR